MVRSTSPTTAATKGSGTVLKNTRLSSAGYISVTLHDSGKVDETEVRICVHCGLVIPMRKGLWTPLREQRKPIRRGYCMRCDGPVCGLDRCVVCIPKEKRLDLAANGVDLATIHLQAERFAVSVGTIWTPRAHIGK